MKQLRWGRRKRHIEQLATAEAKLLLEPSTTPEGVGSPSAIEINPMQRETQEPLSLRLVPRCCAKTRSGRPCQSPRVKGKGRCRMHGGAKGSGAPKGKKNGRYEHGCSPARPSNSAGRSGP